MTSCHPLSLFQKKVRNMVISVILITDEHDVPPGFEMAGNMEILV